MANRPGTRLRGYGSQHERLREIWTPDVAQGGVRCARVTCRLLIPPGGWGRCPAILASGRVCGKNHRSWDLGHDDKDRNRWTGPEHCCCNRGAPGKRRRKRLLKPSRRW